MKSDSNIHFGVNGHVSPDELVDLLGSSGDHSADGDSGLSFDSSTAVLDLFDPGSFGYSPSDIAVGLVASEEDCDVAPDVAQTLHDAAQRCISNTRTTARKKSELVSFNEEDFEGQAQRDAFLIIKLHKNMLFGSGGKPADQWKAIDFFFTYSDDGESLTFDLCCRTLSARIDVIRLRIHYEFFLRWFVSPVDFPFLTVPVPEIIEGEIAYVGGPEGRRLATLAWNKPGITTGELLERAGDTPSTRNALVNLEERFILCQQSEGYWYLTGRNPYLMRKRIAEQNGGVAPTMGGSTIHWSKLL